MQQSPARFPARLVLAGVTGLLLLPALAAQPYRYGLADKGRVVVDGVLLDKLPSNYDPDDGDDFQQRWLDLFVTGADRWVVRLDGVVFHNGAKAWTLPSSGFAYWIGITGDPDGVAPDIWALRNDGTLAKNDEPIAQLPLCDTCGFSDLVSDGVSVWTLRTDGKVYQDTVASPLFSFEGGDGVNGNPDGTNNDPSTWWTRLVLDGDMLYALRQDGIVFAGDTTSGETAGELQTDLPGPPPGEASTLSGNLYLDLAMDASGRWLALRGDGAVWRSDNTLSALHDFNGDPIGNQAVNQLYFGLETDVDDVSALRFDGKVFTGADEDAPLVDFAGDRFFAMASSDTAPDLSNIKNAKPKATKIKAFGVEGEPVSIFVQATDSDKAEDDLVVTPVEPLPEGSAWDPDARTLSWATPVAGNHKATFLIDDGKAKKAVKSKVKLKVLEKDTDPEVEL